jgi:hypothetical protein
MLDAFKGIEGGIIHLPGRARNGQIEIGWQCGSSALRESRERRLLIRHLISQGHRQVDVGYKNVGTVAASG